MRREICGECGAPINDEGSCICTELLKHGWRQCAKGQKATQWCAIAESVRGERWADDMRSASAMFLEAGVGFEYLENR